MNPPNTGELFLNPAELEERVRQRTAELTEANLRLSRELEQRKAAEKNLAESLAQYKASFEVASIGKAHAELFTARLLRVNAALCRLTGYDERELLDRTFLDITHPDDRQTNLESFERLCRGEIDNFQMEKRYVKKGGEVIWAHAAVNLVRDAEGRALRAVAHIQDITERKRVQEALLESEKRFRVMADWTPVMIWVTDSKGDIEFVNHAYEEFFGVSEQEIKSNGWIPLVHPADAPSYSGAFFESLRAGRPFHASARVRRRDGGWRWVESFGGPRFSESGEYLGIVGNSRDVTEQKLAEEALRNSKAAYETMAETMPGFVWASDAEGNLEYANRRWGRYTGLSLKRLKSGWTEVCHPDDLPKVREKWEEAKRQVKQFSDEFRCRRYDGTYQWFLGVAAPLNREDGRAEKWIGVMVNIEEEKRYEDRLGEERDQLKQINKEMDFFVQIVTHDLKSPLRTIRSFSELILKKSGDRLDEEAKSFFAQILEANANIHKLIEDLIHIYRVTRIRNPYESVDTAHMVREINELLKHDIQEHGVEVHAAETLPTIEADPLKLRHIFQNLLNNAIKYSAKKGGRIRIGYDDRGEHHEFHVKDNGIGIDREYFDKIFRPFSRLHNREEYEGSGSGLYIAKRLVEDHKGQIWVNSKTGKGSTFYFKIPKRPLREKAQ